MKLSGRITSLSNVVLELTRTMTDHKILPKLSTKLESDKQDVPEYVPTDIKKKTQPRMRSS